VRAFGQALAQRLWAASPSLWAKALIFCLRPGGWLYGRAMSLRWWAYAHDAKTVNLAGLPVISVGNLTLGGTGKTPLVGRLAREGLARGLKPAVLSRGYGGALGPGPVLVRAGTDPGRVGDEAALLAQTEGLLVLAGSDRVAAAALAAREGADLILVDDGFQHLRLGRGLDLILLDAASPLGNGRVFPAGPLREPASALSRAQALILTRTPEAGPPASTRELLGRLAPGRPIFTARHRVRAVIDPLSGRPEDLAGRRLLVAAGVARPHEVARAALDLGAAEAELLLLADHQSYGPAQVDLINRRLRSGRAEALLTTAKDWAKLAPLAGRLEAPVRLAELEIELDDQAGLWRLIEEAAQGRGAVPGVVARARRPLPREGSLLVRLPNWVGDAVLAAPVLSNLRAALPGWRIHLLATPWTAPLFAADPRVDGLTVYQPRGAHRGLAGRRRLGRELAGRFQAGLLLPNSFDSALIFYLAGLKRRIGYSRDLRRPLLTDAAPLSRNLRSLHQVEYYLALLTYLGLPAPERVPRLFLDPEPEGRTDDLLSRLGLEPGEPFLALAPGAAFGPAKRWPAERFAAAAEVLTSRLAGRALILGSTSDGPLGQRITSLAGRACLDLTGRTSLGEAAVLLQRASLLLTNDSGLMHLAAALGRPLVALFGPTDPARTGPRGPCQRLLVAQADCAPCLKPDCPKERPCLEEITVEEVVRAGLNLLAEAGATAP